jgi:hypothetical protein
MIRAWLDFISTWLGASVKRDLAVLWLAGALVVVAGAQPASAAHWTAPTAPVPLLAYYSMAHEADSWNSEASDVPLLGRYSSDDPAIVRKHIRLAKQAGIDGFIVSWRNTPRFNARLEQLLATADGEDFKLAISYQGLDAQDNPLALSKVGADLDYFVRHYSRHAALTIFGKPVIIWSGIWQYSPEDVASVTNTRRQRLLVLASARDLDEYQRVADSVDVTPTTGHRQTRRRTRLLRELGSWQRCPFPGGLWFAPRRPASSSSPAGGRSIATMGSLCAGREAATASTPDAIGLIS